MMHSVERAGVEGRLPDADLKGAARPGSDRRTLVRTWVKSESILAEAQAVKLWTDCFSPADVVLSTLDRKWSSARDIIKAPFSMCR